jgi:hypothetical protein
MCESMTGTAKCMHAGQPSAPSGIFRNFQKLSEISKISLIIPTEFQQLSATRQQNLKKSGSFE